MSLLDGAGLAPALDGGPALQVEDGLLDRVPYAATLGPFALLGERLSVRCQDADLGAFLAAFLAAFPPADGARTRLDVVALGGRWVAYANGVRAAWTASMPAMARHLVWELNRLALNAPSPDVHVHAAVASRGGRAVVLPGRSGAGKTTLVAALALAGWAYLSDEVAAVGAGATLAPYPRPLALEPGSWPLLPGAAARWPAGVPALVADIRLVLPATLGGPPAAPARPAAVVFPEVVAGGGTTLHPLGRAEALERLLALTFNLPAVRREGFDRLAALVRGSACHRLVLDGVGEAPALLAAVVADRHVA